MKVPNFVGQTINIFTFINVGMNCYVLVLIYVSVQMFSAFLYMYMKKNIELDVNILVNQSNT